MNEEWETKLVDGIYFIGGWLYVRFVLYFYQMNRNSYSTIHLSNENIIGLI